MTAPHPMRCERCGTDFADRQPGSLCPKCHHELTAAPAPDAATVESIMALAHQMRLACLNWIDLPPGEERARRCTEYQNACDTLRAAVEQVLQRRDTAQVPDSGDA